MDADDILLSNFYSSLINILKSNSLISVVCSNHILIHENFFHIGKINYVTNSILNEHFSSGKLNNDWIKSSKIFSFK